MEESDRRRRQANDRQQSERDRQQRRAERDRESLSPSPAEPAPEIRNEVVISKGVASDEKKHLISARIPAHEKSHKERDSEREREREGKSDDMLKELLLQVKKERNSKELGPLDHRGETADSNDKKAARDRGLIVYQQQQQQQAHHHMHQRSPCLNNVIYPLISEVRQSNGLLLNYNAKLRGWTSHLSIGKVMFF